MNTGVADAYDLGWKLAATVNGWAGPHPLASYNEERRPVAQLAAQWSKVHMGKLSHMPAVTGITLDILNLDTIEGQQMRDAVHDYLEANDGHNRSIGVEMGYHYQSRICVPSPLDNKVQAPEFDARKYIPTTCQGYRAPHVFLADGSSIYDHFGKEFTLIAFQNQASSSPAKEIECHLLTSCACR